MLNHPRDNEPPASKEEIHLSNAILGRLRQYHVAGRPSVKAELLRQLDAVSLGELGLKDRIRVRYALSFPESRYGQRLPVYEKDRPPDWMEMQARQILGKAKRFPG